MIVVYLHRKATNGEVFYVGIGRSERPSEKRSRTKWWRNIVNKHGYTIEVTHKNLIWEDACSIEKYLIAFYGRKNLCTGTLINLTDGGDGSNGYKPTEESKRKTSESLKGLKRTSEEVTKSLNARKLMGVYKKLSRRVRRTNIVTGKEIVFDTLTEASIFSRVPRSTIHLSLNNKTNKNGEKYLAGGFDWEYAN